MVSISKKQQLDEFFQQNNIDIAFCSETKVNANDKWPSQRYSFFFSSSVDNKKREEYIKTKEEKKATRNNANLRVLYNQIAEHAGVCVVIKHKLIPFINKIDLISSRTITITLKTPGKLTSLIGVYAPHSNIDIEIKESFYNQLNEVTRKLQQHSLCIGGDFNVRFQRVNEIEETCCGSFFNPLYSENAEHSERNMENRQLFFSYAANNHLKHLNSHFDLEDSKAITFREIGTKLNAPVEEGKWAILDHILVNSSNIYQDYDFVGSNTQCNHGSNHFPIFVKLKTNEYYKEERISYKIVRYFKPDERQSEAFNKSVMGLLVEGRTFADAIHNSAKATLIEKPPNLKKDYLSRETWELITERDVQAVNKNSKPVHQLNNEIKRKAKADKENDLFQRFNIQEDDQYHRNSWKTIKQLRTSYKPTNITLKTIVNDPKYPNAPSNTFIPIRERAEYIATYLQERQWKGEAVTSDHTVETEPQTDTNDRNAQSTFFSDQFPDDEFTNRTEQNFDFSGEELEAVLTELKNNKQPGPDCVINELFTYLNLNNRINRLQMLNQWFKQQDAPKDIFQAKVVSLFKKGDVYDIQL